MKRSLALLLSALMVFTLVACGQEAAPAPETDTFEINPTV